MKETKITIEEMIDGKRRAVSISVPCVDFTIERFRDDVLRPALLAYGYVEKTVDELLGE